MTMDFSGSTGFWILGGNFLQNYMTIYDVENRKIGFVGAVTVTSVPWVFKDYITLFCVIGLLFVLLVLMY